ncbi:MAG: TRAP transporter substrate-binding protein DctP [Betaproteobacteria bacterium]|nr:TRAP transporter substrate-binding protein DctP [Betaproteobacteria bacterium]MDH4324602.1 TRAP transporter substrate-binding protein DctP [Betaproteobacteria bacterium]MDH5210457.1 TRAP transporter substrate-binding protein DctP [Betaproteobacteria bacterium]
MTPQHRLFIGALAAGLAAGAQAADYTMRLSHQFPPAHHSAKNMEQFAADVKANTNGKVEVQIFGAAQLYKPNQHHAAVAGGKIESAIVLSFQWGGTIPEMNVTIIPYFMSSVDKMRKFPGSEPAKMLDAKMLEKGVRNIAWFVDANDGIFTSAKAPLIRPEDFKGVKIRGLSKLWDEGLVAMGAAPSAMPGSEVYQALQTGVIDAGFTGVQAAFSRRFYEVQKFGVASNIILAYDNLIVNPEWWEKLPADVKKGILDAVVKAEARVMPKDDEIPSEHLQQLRERGMAVTALSAAQKKLMADAMQPAVIKAFSASSPDAPRLLELIRGL